MLEHMKMPPTNSLKHDGIKIYFATTARYVIPQEKEAELSNLLENLKYVKKIVNPKIENDDDEFLTIEEVFAEDIKKFTSPGLALQGARQKEGYTQIQLAKKMRIRQENLSKMERGKRPISLKMAKRFAKVLKVNYKIFL